MKIFLTLFAIVSAAHIAAIVLQKEWVRRISKILIIPFLLAAFIAGGGFVSGGLFTILALVFGWIGDILLIRKKKRNVFKLGILSFLLGHLCYIAAFLEILGFFSVNGRTVNAPTILLFIPVLIIGGIFVFGLIKPFREMRIVIIIYMLIIMSLCLWGFEVFFFNPNVAGALVFLGCLLFIISDTLLAYYAFRKLKLFPAVMVMLTYIMAQTEIVLGILWI